MTIVLVTILPHILIGAAAFGLLTLIAFWGLSYTWWHRRGELEWATLLPWRRTVANIGLLTVTLQAVIFILSWTWIGHDYALFGRWAGWVLPTFLVAVPCVLAGKGKSRWWLLSSSVLLFIICFFIVLSA